MAVKKEHRMHLTDYLWVLKKRSLLVLGIWAVVFIPVAILTWMSTPMYRASALMLIERNYQQPIVPGVATPATPEEFYQSQYRILRSRRIARKLYMDMKMYDWQLFRNLGPDRDPIEVVQNWIRITPIPGTHNVEIWMLWPYPKQAADMVNSVCFTYQNVVQEYKTTSIEKSVQALLLRTQDIERKLDDATRQIRSFTTSRELYILPELRRMVLSRQESLMTALGQAELDRITTQSEYETVAKNIEAGTLPVESDLLQRLREKLYAIQEAILSDKRLRTPAMRQRDNLAQQLDTAEEETQRQVAVETDRLQKAKLADVSQRLATAQANYDVLSDMLKNNREMLATMSQDALTLEGLQKRQENYEEMRKVLQTAQESVRTAQEYEDTIAQIIDPADVPREKYSPKTVTNLSLGLGVGLLVGIGFAFFMEYLNTTIRMPRDIEDGLDLPVLGFVPAMSRKLKDFQTRALISHLDPGSGPAEAYRNIRTEMLLSAHTRQVKTIMITSTSPQEGKTTVATNLAITMAQAGNKVLLIDADLRRPMIHLPFNIKADQGLSTLLSEKETSTVYIKKTDIENLHLLPGGPVPTNPAELLASRKMRTLVAEAAERYDIVILDAAPVLGVADANILSTMVDAVLLVIQASKNRRGLVIRAKNQLASVNARVAGAVLNNVRGTKGDFYYYRQYYRPVAQLAEPVEAPAASGSEKGIS